MLATSTAGCDPELDELMRSVEAQRLARAGLRGTYARADCPEGREAHAAALAGRGTYLWGEPGTGKTYAAACAVRLWVEGGGSARLVSAKGLLDEVREGWDTGDRSALARAKRVGLLALDDLGAEQRSPWSMATLEDLVDARASAGLPTVVTSNLRIGRLRDLWGGVEGKRIASRLGGACDAREVSGPDRRLHG